MSVDIDEHGQYENIRVSIRVRPESLVERNEGECLTVIADAVTNDYCQKRFNSSCKLAAQVLNKQSILLRSHR